MSTTKQQFENAIESYLGREAEMDWVSCCATAYVRELEAKAERMREAIEGAMRIESLWCCPPDAKLSPAEYEEAAVVDAMRRRFVEALSESETPNA